MKTSYAVTIMMLVLFLVPACTQKVDDPADAEAIKNLNAGYAEAYSSRDLDWIRANFYTEDAVTLPPNETMASGMEAVVALDQGLLDRYNPTKLSTPVEKVSSSGDLAVARGTYTWSGTPTGSGVGEATSEGKWIGTFARQADGSWKCAQMIYNSDQPAAGATADGKDEEALLQVERDWTEAILKRDRNALDKIMAKEFVGNSAEGSRNKSQAISDFTNRYKFESSEIVSMQPMVFGDTAVVYGVSNDKLTDRGKDVSGKYQWTDIFKKRDGNWLCVGGYLSPAE